jgi:AbrB family looped-hinge helix DNA binding protein
MSEKLIAVAKTSSKGSSLRITIPKEVAEKLNISESEHIGFYSEDDKVIVKKIE